VLTGTSLSFRYGHHPSPLCLPFPPAGYYTLVVSTFEPQMHSNFSLTVECSHRFDLEALPLEGAGMFLKTIKGTWSVPIIKYSYIAFIPLVSRRGGSAAGPSSQGGYAANPTYKLTVPSQTQLQYVSSYRSVVRNQMCVLGQIQAANGEPTLPPFDQCFYLRRPIISHWRQCY
jgi:hypothetical protein